MLSRREEIRIGAAWQYAAWAFQEHLDAGETVRLDWFAEDKKWQTSAEETVAGVLILAHRQYQERQIEHLGYLLANVAFTLGLDRHVANWVIKIFGELTWAHLVLLAIVGGDEHTSLPDREIART